MDTVHKLYAMIRNEESWNLGEPRLNNKAQPAIHDIVSKLGYITSQDISVASSKGLKDSIELQAKFEGAHLNADAKEAKSMELSCLKLSSPHAVRPERARSTNSDHSKLHKEYSQNSWPNQPLEQCSTENTKPYMPPPFTETESLRLQQLVQNDGSYINAYGPQAQTLISHKTTPYNLWSTSEFELERKRTNKS